MLPSIRPTIVFVLVLLVIGASQVFTQVYLLTQGGPYGSTHVLLSDAYQQAFTFFQFSYAAAIASVMAVVVLALSILQIRVLRRGDVREHARVDVLGRRGVAPLATPPPARPSRACSACAPGRDAFGRRAACSRRSPSSRCST